MSYGTTTRRDFNVGLAATIAATFSPLEASIAGAKSTMTKFGPAVGTYRLNPAPYEVDTKMIRKALESDKPVKDRGKQVPDILNLLQSCRIRSSKRSYNEEMKKNFQREGPIEIALVEGMAANHNIENVFLHSKSSGGINRAYIDADRGMAKFVEDVSYALQHASFGQGKTRAFGLQHQALSAMHAFYPELQTLPKEKDPLALYIDEFRNSIRIKRDDIYYYHPNISYLGYLGNSFMLSDEQDKLTLKRVADDILYVTFIEEEVYLQFALSMVESSADMLDDIAVLIPLLSLEYVSSVGQASSKNGFEFFNEKLLKPPIRVVKKEPKEMQL